MEVAEGAWRCVVVAYINVDGRLGGYCRLHLVDMMGMRGYESTDRCDSEVPFFGVRNLIFFGTNFLNTALQ